MTRLGQIVGGVVVAVVCAGLVWHNWDRTAPANSWAWRDGAYRPVCYVCRAEIGGEPCVTPSGRMVCRPCFDDEAASDGGVSVVPRQDD
jgi:hypothetical protein